ncbi:MAG: alkaline phosphatase family protein [Planctomycetaceae bacterium]|nr:alkaline phosphatase family protein [Planctomycetaceae bacterium]
MAASPPVICLEFNGLVPSLMDKFIEQGKLPYFRRLRDQSIVQVTDPQAEGEWLTPWVQWVTVHSGLSPEDHGILRLSQAHELESPSIWDLVSQSGQSVWSCGSMNPWYGDDLRGHILPDPWSRQVEPFPRDEFQICHRFVQQHVQNHAAPKIPVSTKETLQFLVFLAKHGLQLSTVTKLARQLLRERIGNHRWRRASLLDQLQYDVFEWYYRQHRPALATYFMNSTAHYQHRYWRNMDPDAFLIKPTAGEQRDYGKAIEYGYQQMDSVVERVLRLAPEATIMLISGLGQQAYSQMDRTGGKRVFRLRGPEVLSQELGVQGEFQYEPAAGDEFAIRFDREEDAERAATHLQGVLLPHNEPAFAVQQSGTQLMCQCRCRELPAKDAELQVPDMGHRIPFADVFYRLDCVKSGQHHPDGVWWIRLPTREHRVVKPKVPLTAIAPTILELLGIEKPTTMKTNSVFAKTTTPPLSGVLEVRR